MSRKLKLPVMAERCRICLLDHGSMTNLHDERVKTKLKDLIKCTSIDIKHEENLPSAVCHICLYKLDMWSEFKKQFVQSNKILLEQLGVSDISDNTTKDSSKNERSSTESMKRKHTNKSGEDSISDNDKKKCKRDVSSLEHTGVDSIITDQTALKTLHISDESTLPKDSSDKVSYISDSNKFKKNGESGSEEHGENKSSSGFVRARLLPGKRGRAIERRKASTKRWVERKKALMAANGENISDTDSIASDEAQLSPVQKARAKTNADKEAERQKRIAKVLKNLETNLTEKYTAIRDGDIALGDMDSDTRRTRLSKESYSNNVRESNKNSLKQADKYDVDKKDKSSSQENSMEKENFPISTTICDDTTDRLKKLESLTDREAFTSHSMKSEVMVGDTKYVVTLILTGSPPIDKENLNDLTKDCKTFNIDENSQEKNTDIIDAVQLRRIHPISANSNSKKFVERCLNIEVECTELEALKHIQIELASFVEKEIKYKLFGTNGSSVTSDKMENGCAKPHRKLDQQLKGMIERAIRNNIESSFMRNAADVSINSNNWQFTRISPALVKTAMDSPKYQPKVMVKRLDIAKESKRYKINVDSPLKKNKLVGPFSAISRKRQSVPPKKYNDFNTSALDSNSEESDDKIVQETPGTENISNIRTCNNLMVKQSPESNSQVAIKQIDNSAIKTVAVNNVTSLSFLSVGQKSAVTAGEEQKADYEDAIRIEEAITENHICGVCGLSFSSRKEVEAHVRTHKAASVGNNVTTSRRSQKQKVMRCKRCQEVVEARYVKAHVCKTLAHKCFVCNHTFRTEKLLWRHLDCHDQSEFNIENVTKIEGKKPDNSDVSLRAKLIMSDKEQVEIKAHSVFIANEIQSDKINSTLTKLDGANIVVKPKETYTCFVCDKIFTDEEVLKDHLQKHCDDLSDGEQSNSKEQYQCAICGDTLESDNALEEHVGKHLFDDEDDNPNLISIGDEEKQKAKTYRCGQCSEIFDSEVLLEIHMQAHEEEMAIAEWEKKGLNIYPYQCMLCDCELVETEEELTDHLYTVHNISNGNLEICQLCEKAFRTLEDLQKHVETH